MASRKKTTVDRDQQILSRLANIQNKVDSIEQTNAFVLRADAEKHRESVRKVFGTSKRTVQVYLAADGDRTVNDIAAHLGMKSPNVSAALKKLREEELLEVIDTDGGAHFYAKTLLDRTIRISPFLCKEYKLTKDGKELPP